MIINLKRNGLIDYLNKDIITMVQFNSRLGLFLQMIKEAKDVTPEKWREHNQALLKLKAKLDLQETGGWQVIIDDDETIHQINQVIENIKKALGLSRIQNRYFLSILMINYIETLKQAKLNLNKLSQDEVLPKHMLIAELSRLLFLGSPEDEALQSELTEKISLWAKKNPL